MCAALWWRTFLQRQRWASSRQFLVWNMLRQPPASASSCGGMLLSCACSAQHHAVQYAAPVHHEAAMMTVTGIDLNRVGITCVVQQPQVSFCRVYGVWKASEFRTRASKRLNSDVIPHASGRHSSCLTVPSC